MSCFYVKCYASVTEILNIYWGVKAPIRVNVITLTF